MRERGREEWLDGMAEARATRRHYTPPPLLAGCPVLTVVLCLLCLFVLTPLWRITAMSISGDIVPYNRRSEWIYSVCGASCLLRSSVGQPVHMTTGESELMSVVISVSEGVLDVGLYLPQALFAEVSDQVFRNAERLSLTFDAVTEPQRDDEARVVFDCVIVR